jgi:hypothetical protein
MLAGQSSRTEEPDDPAVVKAAIRWLPLYKDMASEELPAQVVNAFRTQMDDDLGIGSAIDHIHAIVLELCSRDRGGGLPSHVRKELKKNVKAVDTVSQVLAQAVLA